MSTGRRVSLSESESQTLVQRVRGGDELAFQEVYLAFYRPLWEFAYSLTQSAATAEDIVHDVFLVWWERRSQTHITRGLDPYLYGAVRHRALNDRRRERIRQRDDVVAATTERSTSQSAPLARPDAQLDQAETELFLASAISRLPEARRTALLLRLRHDLDYNAIAQILGITPQAAMVHVSRARADLRVIFEKFGES